MKNKPQRERRRAKPEEVKIIREFLTEEELRQIRKENPFRHERDDKIRELVNRGVKLIVLADLSGLSDTAVGYIKRRRYNYSHDSVK